MALEQTLAIIKPDAVASGFSGPIIETIERNGFTITHMRKTQLTDAQVAEFYAVHSHRPFFQEMIDYMTSGPVILMVLQRDNAIACWRELMGATNPADAAMGTIRKQFGKSIAANATHGSDAAETAHREILQFFGA